MTRRRTSPKTSALEDCTLAGGHAQLSDFAELIATNTGVEVTVAEDPDTVVIRGLRLCLEEMASLHSLYRDADR